MISFQYSTKKKKVPAKRKNSMKEKSPGKTLQALPYGGAVRGSPVDSPARGPPKPPHSEPSPMGRGDRRRRWVRFYGI